MTARLFVNASQVVTCAGPARARRGEELRDANVLTRSAVAVEGERIALVAGDEEVRRRFPDAELVDCARGILLPGLVDSHTHAIFGRPRFEEQEMRSAGLDYMDIARRGGGSTPQCATCASARKTTSSRSHCRGWNDWRGTGRPRWRSSRATA